ncbi:hypothetical protein BH24ACT15_BH24ACT15_07610 [soil metagenome]|jgi:YgiT-type zinc finger domain-containing protein
MPMKCPLCRSGDLERGTAHKVLTRGDTTLVVKDVPAQICDTCGERFFDAQITQELLDLTRAAVAAGVVVDVRH